MLVDGTPQSHVDLDDPRYLEFEYMRRLGHLIDLAAPDDPFPGRVVAGCDLDRFACGMRPVTDARAQSSPAPPPGILAVRREPDRLA